MSAAKTISLTELSAWADQSAQKIASADTMPAMQQSKLAIIRSTDQNFKRESSPDGIPWAPTKMRVRGNGKTLWDRGILAGSVSAAGQGHYETITRTELAFGSKLEYAGIHQYGGTIKPGGGKKFLAIPRTTEAYRVKPRSFPGLHFVLSKNGRTATLRDKGNKVQYLLLPEVVIPARPFLGWNAEMADTCEHIWAEFWAKQLS